MTEQSSHTPEQTGTRELSETQRVQQENFRWLVDARVHDEPMDGSRADYEAENFGLEPGKYTVYADTEHPFGGGFKKFVSNEDADDTLVGLSYMHIGGNMSDPNKAVHSYLLKPNGDIAGTVFSENSKGVTRRDIDHSASSADPEKAQIYDRFLAKMNKKADELITKAAEELPRVAPEIVPRPTESRLKKWLGRTSLK